MPIQTVAPCPIHGKGEMAARIRSHAWETTDFGALEQWPPELLTLVNLMLASREIMTIFWGPDRLMIYNDAYITQLGPRHPALGQPLRTVWPDVVDQVTSLIDPAFDHGKSSYLDDTPLLVTEDGKLTERFYSASFEPIWVRGTGGSAVRGVYQTAINNTSKVLAQRRLQASEAQALQILQSIGDAVIVTDPEGRVLQLNPVAEALTGWQLTEAKGRPAPEVCALVNATSRQPLESFVDTARRLGNTVQLPGDTVLMGRWGSEFHISATGAPVTGKAGDVTGFVLIFRDISAERQIQLAQESAAARQQFLLELTDAQRDAPDGRAIMQRTVERLGRYLRVDRAGFSEASADLQSMHFETGWSQGSLQPLTGSVPLNHWSEGTSNQFLRGRTIVYCDVRTEPMLDQQLANYEAVGAIAVLAVPFLRRGVWKGSLYLNHPEARQWSAEEVSLVEEVARRTSEAMERAQAEDEVRSLASRLGMAQQAGQMASWQWDFASDTLVWDGGSEWTFGRSPSEMTQVIAVFSYIHEDDREKVRRDLMPAIDGTGEYRSEFRVIWPDGSLHWLLAFGRTVRGNDGNPVGIVGLNANVTEQKHTEASLLQTEKLAAVGRLASTMAHEINNPLEAVTNLLYLARRSGDLAEAQPYLETADAELRRAAAITSQALQFHRQATRPTLSSFGQLTHDLFKGRHNRLRNAGAGVQQRDHTSTPVLCFEGEIRQVLNNFISNAIDALKGRGGTLYLRGKDGKDWRTGRAGMVLTVADSGSGMSRATQKRLFDAFFTTKGISGTGLGLWVSKEIVERHAGHLQVRSSERPGTRGTVFTVFLPYEAVVRDNLPADEEQIPA